MRSKYINPIFSKSGSHLKHKIGGRVASNNGSLAEALVGVSAVRMPRCRVLGTAQKHLSRRGGAHLQGQHLAVRYRKPYFATAGSRGRCRYASPGADPD